MAQAHCLNESCDKTEWTLRKPVSEYRGGSPQCPDCGTTNVRVQTEGNEETVKAQSHANPSEEQKVEAVEAVDETQEVQPAADAGNFVNAAEQTGQMLAHAKDASPEEKAELEGTVLTGIGRAIVGYAGQRTQARKEGAERARATEKETINPVEEYPQCGSCGVQLRNLPAEGNRFDCPRCGTRLQA